MIFNQNNYNNFNTTDLRELFCNAVTKIFGGATSFLDFIEGERYSLIKYDCYLDYSGENYIINRETGEYINWYKLTHLGRCINISTFHMYKNIPKWIEEFLVEFKESERKNDALAKTEEESESKHYMELAKSYVQGITGRTRRK